MLQVKEERITNKLVRERFFKLPNAESMIAARQFSYLGKMVRNHGDDHLPKQLLTAWGNNPQSRGQPLYTNKKSLINRNPDSRTYLSQLPIYPSCVWP
jgi:hypothetical protein